jgi:hypothetical protein
VQVEFLLTSTKKNYFRKMKTLYLLSVVTLLCSCFGSEKKTEKAVPVDSTQYASGDTYSQYYKLDSYLTESPVEAKDVQEIDSTCAIIITPSIAQMQAMEKEYGDDFESVVDDAFYYQGMAISILDSLQINRIKAKEVPFVLLKGSNSRNYTLNIRKLGLPEWNIVFFDIYKQPEIISAIDLTPEKAKDYFAK